jgi:hypothetical protein
VSKILSQSGIVLALTVLEDVLPVSEMHSIVMSFFGLEGSPETYVKVPSFQIRGFQPIILI